MSILSKQRKIQLSKDCEKALVILKEKVINVNYFIRQSVEEKLYKDFRKILNNIEKENNKICPF